MNNSKLAFLPPLLFSILLFTISNLKLGIFLNTTTDFLLQPIIKPSLSARLELNKQFFILKNLPLVNTKNQEQKLQIAHLIRENEILKQTLKDSKTQVLLQNSFEKVLPIKVSGLTDKITATSSQKTSEVKPGMPVVSGNILIGIVTEVDNNNISLISLENELFPPIVLKSSSGPMGVYRRSNGTSQIINVPSQTPLILGDFVLTDNSELIPANLLIGKVTKLLTTPQDPIQKGEVDLYDTILNTSENLVIILKP